MDINSLRNTQTIIDKIYPIGSIYISTNNINPSDIFGFGEWIAFGDGRTLVGTTTESEEIGGSNTATLSVSNLPSHNHTFTGNSHTHSWSGTISSSGAHTHRTNDNNSSYGFMSYTDSVVERHRIAKTSVDVSASNAAGYIFIGTETSAAADSGLLYSITTNSTGAHTHTVSGTAGGTTASGTISNTGSGASFDIQNPYITVYMWKRTK